MFILHNMLRKAIIWFTRLQGENQTFKIFVFSFHLRPIKNLLQIAA